MATLPRAHNEQMMPVHETLRIPDRDDSYHANRESHSVSMCELDTSKIFMHGLDCSKKMEFTYTL